MSNRTRHISTMILLSPDERSLLDALSKEEGVPMVEIIVRALKAYHSNGSIEARLRALEEWRSNMTKAT